MHGLRKVYENCGHGISDQCFLLGMQLEPVIRNRIINIDSLNFTVWL